MKECDFDGSNQEQLATRSGDRNGWQTQLDWGARVHLGGIVLYGVLLVL